MSPRVIPGFGCDLVPDTPLVMHEQLITPLVCPDTRFEANDSETTLHPAPLR
jgi:hypothetical protein